MPISIARRYARGLYEVVHEAGEVDATLVALEAIAAALDESAELSTLIESPQVTRDQRKGVLLGIAEGEGFSVLFCNFLKLLVDRNRTPELPLIARLFQAMADEGAGRVRAEVVTALPLPDVQATELSAALSKATGKTVVLSLREDPAIIGGLAAKVGDRLYDGTLKTSLARMRERALA